MNKRYVFNVSINKEQAGCRDLYRELDAIGVYYTKLYNTKMTKGSTLLTMFNEIEHRHQEIVPVHRDKPIVEPEVAHE